jgi:hypothetical protein
VKNPARQPRSTGKPTNQRTAQAGSFKNWIRSMPGVFTALGTAVAALFNLLAPSRILPEPLSGEGVRYLLVLFSIIAFGTTWAWQGSFRRHIKRISIASAAAAVALLLLYLWLVRPIDSDAPASETTFYLTGGPIPQSSKCGPDYQSAIIQCGDDWPGLTKIWGSRYVVVVTLFTLVYISTITSLIILLGTATQVRSRTR